MLLFTYYLLIITSYYLLLLIIKLNSIKIFKYKCGTDKQFVRYINKKCI